MTRMNEAYGYPEKFHPLAVEFFGNYILEKEIWCPDEKVASLIPSKNRVCRFCGKKYPSVTFRKDAHIFSEFLGNRYLVSDFECDDCNLKFGTYEDHLSKFLGIARTMLAMKGKEKIPKFKSPGKTVVLESTISENSHTLIRATRSEVLDNTFEFDKETKTTKVHFTKHPYIPLLVYKALLKMALSCIDSKETPAYKMAFEYLQSKRYDRTWMGFAKVYQYVMPYSFCYTKPLGFLFRKRNSNNPLYTHVFLLFALNSIYQFILPFYFYDLQFVNAANGGLILPWSPPLFGREYPFPVDTIQHGILDLCSPDTLKGKQETVSFSGTEESYEIARIIDKRTGEIRDEKFDGTKIRGIDFVRTPLGSPPIEGI